MKVQVSVFPIAGTTEKKQELQITMEKGSLEEALARIEERLDINLPKIETLLLLRNGQGLNKNEELILKDGDQLWVLPQLSGG